MIVLWLDSGTWYAMLSGELGVRALTLFGTRLLPTPYTGVVAAETVLAAISRLNPGVEVRIGEIL